MRAFSRWRALPGARDRTPVIFSAISVISQRHAPHAQKLPDAVAKLQHQIAIAERELEHTAGLASHYPLAPDKIAHIHYTQRFTCDDRLRNDPRYPSIGIEDLRSRWKDRKRWLWRRHVDNKDFSHDRLPEYHLWRQGSVTAFLIVGKILPNRIWLRLTDTQIHRYTDTQIHRKRWLSLW